MPQKTSLGERVRLARKARSLSQAILSERAGLQRSHIERIEGGGNENVTLETAKKLAGVLQVTVGWLVNGEGSGPSRAA